MKQAPVGKRATALSRWWKRDILPDKGQVESWRRQAASFQLLGEKGKAAYEKFRAAVEKYDRRKNKEKG